MLFPMPYKYDNLTFMAINGSGDESEDFLRRKLAVVHKLAVMNYGATLQLLKVELPSARKKAWQSLGLLIDSWQLLFTQQQSFLVEVSITICQLSKLHDSLEM